jgi:FMN phosphatase YigB (HAD superfamily)/DNA-binding XRE family transcriptional regulator
MAMNDGGGKNLEKLLGKRIQTFRRQAGLTQQSLCQRANISYSTLTKIERGAIKSPSIFTVESIADAIGVGLDNLLGKENNLATNQKHKSRSGISFVYFDVNGCLVRFYQRAFTKIAEEYDIPNDVVETAFWHYNAAACKGILTLDEFNKKIASRLHIPEISWQKYYLDAAESVPHTSDLVGWVHRYYRLGLLTNIMPGLLSALRHNGQVPNVEYDSVVDSSEVGHIKPETKMFEIAENRANAKSSEILLIDDDRANLTAADKFGWHVLWFDYSHPEESVKHIKDSLKLD